MRLLLLAIQFFGMSALDDSPSHNIPPYDVVQGNGDQKLYFDTILNKFVEEYLMPTTHDADSDEEPDVQQLTRSCKTVLHLPCTIFLHIRRFQTCRENGRW